MPMQAPSEGPPPQASGSTNTPMDTPQRGNTERSSVRRHEFQRSDGTPIGIIPLQPPSSEPISPDKSAGGKAPEGFEFDINNMEAMGAFMKEALRRMGASDVNVTKTRKKPSRTSKSRAIKSQQASMSREADMAWKVMQH